MSLHDCMKCWETPCVCKKVYLCGPINGKSDDECMLWREYAKDKLIHPVISPMDRDYRGKEKNNADKIVTKDLSDISTCSALLVNANSPSWGTGMEMVYAKLLGKKIVSFTKKPVSPWVEYHSTIYFYDIDKAIKYLNKLVL